MQKTLSEHRAQWAATAKANGWYKEPFYISVWVDRTGIITSSWSMSDYKSDIFRSSATGKPMSERTARKLMEASGTWD